MKLNKFGLMAIGAASALALAVGLVGGASAQQKAAAGRGVFTVVVDGSSTVFPISEAAGEAFQKKAAGRIRATVAESGTGGGFRKFCRGETHIQGASRPILAAEMATCLNSGVRYVEIPVAFDGLAVVANPGNSVTSITVDELKKVWEPGAQGRITNWKQINPSFPDMALTLYGAGTASGTFDYFTEAVVGKAKSSRSDYTPTEDDNVTVQGVAGDRGAMGYFGMAYLHENASRVKPLAISYKGKAGVLPTVANVEAGTYQPLARPIFIYVNVAALGRPPVQQFVNEYITNGAAYARQVGYVPLPANAYQVGLQRVAQRRVGTAFNGRQDIGSTISEVLARPLVLTAAP